MLNSQSGARFAIALAEARERTAVLDGADDVADHHALLLRERAQVLFDRDRLRGGRLEEANVHGQYIAQTRYIAQVLFVVPSDDFAEHSS